MRFYCRRLVQALIYCKPPMAWIYESSEGWRLFREKDSEKIELHYMEYKQHNEDERWAVFNFYPDDSICYTINFATGLMTASSSNGAWKILRRPDTGSW